MLEDSLIRSNCPGPHPPFVHSIGNTFKPYDFLQTSALKLDMKSLVSAAQADCLAQVVQRSVSPYFPPDYPDDRVIS